MNLFNTDSSRWQAVQTRNPQAANSFVYCVKTTGITCRPNCAARLARRSTVIFHNSFADARAAGFRPCKRCKPEVEVYDPQADIVARACKTIQERAEDVRLNELATKAGLTKSHFHRVFKSVTGVTPRIYGVNLRAETLMSASSSTSTPGLSPAAASLAESEDALAPITPYEGGRDIDRDFTNADLLTMEGFTEEFGKLSSNRTDETVPAVTGQRKDIEYTVQPWASGFVVIAATKDGICWLEAGNSVLELSQSLRNEFPYSEIKASAWPEGFANGGMDSGKHAMFSEVMEALVNPTGKVLNISFDVY